MGKAHDKLLERAKKRLGEAIDAESEIRQQALSDLRFVEGDQWDERDQKDREDNGRPCLVINRLQATAKQIINDGRQNTPRIKVRPYDKQADPHLAEILTGLCKNIENESDADAAYDYAFEMAVKCGLGFIRVVTEYASDDAFEQDIRIKRVENPFAVYIDPSAVKPDRSDMRWAFVVDKLTKEQFEEQFPRATAASLDLSGVGMADAHDDGDIYIAEYWYLEPQQKTLAQLPDGRVVDKAELPEELHEFIVREREVETHQVKWCKLSGAGVLEGPQEWAGRYIPIVPVLGDEVWIEGKLYLRSAFYHAKDPQRLYNWGRSLTAETLAMAPRQPFLATPEQIAGHEEQWASMNHAVHPYLLYNQTAAGAPQRQPSSIPDTGAMQETLAASDEIKACTGVFDASLGQRSNETSGRAILMRQREGDTATFHFHDNLARAIKHIGRVIVDLIPKIYDTERQVRVLGQDQTEKIIMVNKPLPDGTVQHDLSQGKYDVTVDVGPSYATQRLEAADAMIQFIQAFPPAAGVIGPRLAKVLDFPESQEVAQELMAMSQQPNPQAEMEMQKEQLDIQGKELINAKRVVDLQQDTGQQDQRMAQIAEQVAVGVVQRLLGGV